MSTRKVCHGAFELPLPAAEAVALFTPEGERGWAGPGWDPVYPVPGAERDGGAPGTVFTTASDGGPAIWVVVDRRPVGIRYARVAPGRIAGTVEVACRPAAPNRCTVEVTYDVTSLGPDGTAFLEELAAGFDAFLDDWRAAILGHAPAHGMPAQSDG
jgi:hypothetical protein